MKKQLPLGLVLEGSSTHSAILRLPKLAEELGPVKSSAMRIARRFSNLVQGGYAVAEYEELQNARLILLRVPDGSVNRIVRELCASELLMKRLSFVLCETWLTSEVLAPLNERGASVATLVRAPSTERDWFVLEGQVTASRLTRRFVERHEGRAFEIKLGSKDLLFAAELLATILPVPLVAAAQQNLRAGGITGKELGALLEQMTRKMLREVIKGVRLPLNATPSDCSAQLSSQFLAALRVSRPSLTSLVEGHQEASAKLICEAWKNVIDGA
ncbi:MAG TPA: hypothetical protein VFA65_12385 [Bryobacteraceae bacterium]|nr:hypothetical protein [Bryobacteraceae bacterium]